MAQVAEAQAQNVATQAGLRLLALDGGGIRGVSELVILQELMLRMKTEAHLDNVPKPCEVFDLVGGTSTGGLIALLLGRLRLSVEQALDEYGRLGREVFSKKKKGKGHEGVFYATRLEEIIKDVVRRYGAQGGNASPDLLLESSGDMNGCKVFVCTTSARVMDTTRLFKSYGPFAAGDIPRLTIWQAARATSAAPTFFKRIRIGPENREEEFLDGGLGANNPTKLLIGEACRIFEPTRPISCIVSIGCGEASIIDVKEPSFFQNILPTSLIKALAAMTTDCRKTADEMESKFRNMPGLYFRFNVDHGLENVGLEEWKEMGAITSKTISYLGRYEDKVQRAVLSLTSDGETDAINLGQLNPAMSYTIDRPPKSVPSRVVAHDAGSRLTLERDIQGLYDSLSFTEIHARENEIRTRTERARKDTFNWILDGEAALETAAVNFRAALMRTRFSQWLQGHGALFWICGKAASGKSTLMRKLFRDPGLSRSLQVWAPSAKVILASMFFAHQGTRLQKSREGMLRSLLVQGLTIPEIRRAVLKSYLHKIPNSDDWKYSDITWSWDDLSDAFRTLLGQASETLRLFFLIDGLDEYSVLGTESPHPPNYHLDLNDDHARRIRAGYRELALMLNELAERPFIKLCVSSRPLNEFETLFKCVPSLRLELMTVQDIARYVQGEIIRCCSYANAPEYETCVKEVIARAQGVFLWVRIATDIIVDGIINGRTPLQLHDELRQLPSELGGPKGLYMQIVRSLDKDGRSLTIRIFDILYHARHELTALVLSFALSADCREAIRQALKPLSYHEILNESTKMERRLKSCGGLIETYQNNEEAEEWSRRDAHIHRWPSVRLIHLTLDEFLLRPDVRQSLHKMATDTRLEPNTALLCACLLRLKLIGVTKDWCDVWTAVKDGLHYAAQAERVTQSAHCELLDDLNVTVEYLFRTDPRRTDPRQLVKVWENSFRIGLDDLARAKGPFAHVARHWADSEPQEQGGKKFYWLDNFASLAVQANLVLYVKTKLDADPAFLNKPGRPLLAYATIPTENRTLLAYTRRSRDVLGSGFADADMTRVLLDHGADPNATCGDDTTRERPIRDASQRGPRSRYSIWECALGSALEVHIGGRMPPNLKPLWSWSGWKSTTQLLVEHGADPNAISAPTQYQNFELSALTVCLIIEATWLDGPMSVSQLLMQRGAVFADGEIDATMFAELRIGPVQLAEWSRIPERVRSQRP